MLASSARISLPHPIWICITIVGISVLTANFIGASALGTTTNILYSASSIFLLGVALALSFRFRKKGKHGKAWIMFLSFSLLWLGSQAVDIYDYYSNDMSISYAADALHGIGYVFLFMFMMYYIKPMESAITKASLAIAFAVSLGMLIPSIYTIANFYNWTNEIEHAILVISTALNAIVIFPAILGMILFFRGRVSFLWNTFFLAISLCMIADTSLLFSCIPHDCHLSRTPMDTLYLWAYVLFTFGAYSHLKIFKRYKMQHYDNIDDLR